jgi:hypothetical protein
VGRIIPAATPTPAPISFPNDRVYLTIDGVFGAGGSIKAAFSDDGTNFTDYAAYTAAVTMSQLSTILPHRYWRVQVTAGDGTTSLNATMLHDQVPHPIGL